MSNSAKCLILWCAFIALMIFFSGDAHAKGMRMRSSGRSSQTVRAGRSPSKVKSPSQKELDSFRAHLRKMRRK